MAEPVGDLAHDDSGRAVRAGIRHGVVIIVVAAAAGVEHPVVIGRARRVVDAEIVVRVDDCPGRECAGGQVLPDLVRATGAERPEQRGAGNEHHRPHWIEIPAWLHDTLRPPHSGVSLVRSAKYWHDVSVSVPGTMMVGSLATG